MNQIYEIAFSYYIHFYSYKGKLKKLWFLVLASFFMGGVFMYYTYIDMLNVGKLKPEGFKVFYEIWRTLLFEMLFLTCFFKLQGARDDLIVGQHSKINKLKLRRKIVLAKRAWLKQNVQIDEYEYLKFAKEIRTVNELHESYSRQSGDVISIIIRFIYSSDAKTRITSYLIFLMSLFSLLLFKNIEGIQVFFEALIDPLYPQILIVIIIVACVLLVVLFGLMKFISFLVLWIIVVITVFISSKKSSYWFVEVLLCDLVTLYRLPKLNLKRDAGLIKKITG